MSFSCPWSNQLPLNFMCAGILTFTLNASLIHFISGKKLSGAVKKKRKRKKIKPLHLEDIGSGHTVLL